MARGRCRPNYSGYRIVDRGALLDALAAAGVEPAFERVLVDHVTYRYPDTQPAPPTRHISIVGHAIGDGVQVLLVEVDGTTYRSGGQRFHLTYSLAPGHVPADANALLADGAVEPLAPIPLDVATF